MYKLNSSLKVGVCVFVFVFFISSFGFAQSYPTASGNGSDPSIREVIFAGIDNSSGKSSYTDYTGGTSATVFASGSYTLSVEIKKKNHTYLTAWIDWNDDGDFDDSGEEYVLASDVNANGPHTTTVNVGGGVALGEVRMRIACKRNGAPSSDETGFTGEVEDYAVVIDEKSNYFYYVADDNNSLYTINKVTGATSLIGATGVSSIEAISNWPALGGQVLYACDGGTLGTLNTSTGAFTSIGEVDGGGTADGSEGAQSLNDIDGLAFDPRTGTLWASNRRDGDHDLLFKIDPATGLFVSDAFGANIDYIEIAGNGVYETFDDIAISPADGTIYGVSNNGSVDQILSIEVPTGNATVVSSLITATDVEGLAFSMDNKMYGIEGVGDDFTEINWLTGASTMINSSVPGGDPESLAALVEDANLIEGTVYHDDDQSQTNNGESGISGVTVKLYYDENGNGAYDAGDSYLTSKVTDSNGDYFFDYASTGDLVIVVDLGTLPSGYSLTTNNIEEASFSSFANTDSGNDFGADTGSDCDGDGIPDFTEGGGDTDGDGTLDQCDLDSDNDGILDSEETTADKDGDGIPNYLDLDSDNDGIPDAIEANGGLEPVGYLSTIGRITGSDTDGDGLLNSVDNDASTAYGANSYSTAPRGDNDGDGIKDFQDKDSDNDGILDVVEVGGTDANGDGEIDGFSDSNSDGYHDALTSSPLAILNSDYSWENANGLSILANYLDLDSDNDAIDDAKEGYSTNDYQIPSILTDSDNDGILDLYDTNSGGAPIDPNDHDEDGTPDYYDEDSDNDGIDDNIEGNDSNFDQINDDTWANADANGNGIDDAFDNNCSGTTNLNISADDHGEEDQSDGSMYLSSTDIELVNDGSTHQKVGVHFSAVNIPQGETIVGAYIQFQVDEVSTGSVTFTIRGEDENTAATFGSGDDDITDRTLTTASVNWSPADWNTTGESGNDQKTPDLSSIVQEIVNRGGWSSGNSMVFVITGADNSSAYRTAEVDPVLTIQTSGGLSYACGSDIALQDEDLDIEHDFRDEDDDSSPLPIELLSFDAADDDNKVHLNWITATELNNDYFEVQRSADGYNYETIDIVKGAGTSQYEISYQSVDYNPLEGKTYYRLKQVDFDGAFSTSKHVVIDREMVQHEIKVYPNPSKGLISFEADAYGEIQVYSLNGALMFAVEHKGGQQQLNLQELPQGVYSLAFISSGNKQVKKLIIK